MYFRLTDILPTCGEPSNRSRVSGNGRCACQGSPMDGGVSYSFGCSSGIGTRFCKWNNSKDDVKKFQLKNADSELKAEKVGT